MSSLRSRLIKIELLAARDWILSHSGGAVQSGTNFLP